MRSSAGRVREQRVREEREQQEQAALESNKKSAAAQGSGMVALGGKLDPRLFQKGTLRADQARLQQWSLLAEGFRSKGLVAWQVAGTRKRRCLGESGKGEKERQGSGTGLDLRQKCRVVCESMQRWCRALSPQGRPARAC